MKTTMNKFKKGDIFYVKWHAKEKYVFNHELGYASSYTRKSANWIWLFDINKDWIWYPIEYINENAPERIKIVWNVYSQEDREKYIGKDIDMRYSHHYIYLLKYLGVEINWYTIKSEYLQWPLEYLIDHTKNLIFRPKKGLEIFVDYLMEDDTKIDFVEFIVYKKNTDDNFEPRLIRVNEDSNFIYDRYSKICKYYIKDFNNRNIVLDNIEPTKIQNSSKYFDIEHIEL